MSVLVKKDRAYFLIQEILFHLSILLQPPYRHWVQQNGMKLSLMGASEFLNRRVNEELQRAFEAGVPSSHVCPSPEVHHIGTPSERTTSEGFRSAVSQRTPSVQSHPTSSPVSFGSSTPVQSASAAPAGLLSSPGGMSDVGNTLTPPGLPLRDPRRMAGSYGVPLNDPVFGISSGSIPCKNPGQRSIPAQTPPQLECRCEGSLCSAS